MLFAEVVHLAPMCLTSRTLKLLLHETPSPPRLLHSRGVCSGLTPAGNVCSLAQVAEVNIPSLRTTLTIGCSSQISTTTSVIGDGNNKVYWRWWKGRKDRGNKSVMGDGGAKDGDVYRR
ncbi:hypothetical protein Acr_28g0015340 [Actinidia rufa]|uniref:Uncharacterized protein n=1 Tax=Actinidia rufa TaxID=165716 RepID=A0A7J0HCN9_9ERIC|nr:hypothetical protein Acr_28g0015340 [Actinidia rufa]